VKRFMCIPFGLKGFAHPRSNRTSKPSTPASDHGGEKEKKHYEPSYWLDGNFHYYVIK